MKHSHSRRHNKQKEKVTLQPPGHISNVLCLLLSCDVNDVDRCSLSFGRVTLLATSQRYNRVSEPQLDNLGLSHNTNIILVHVESVRMCKDGGG